MIWIIERSQMCRSSCCQLRVGRSVHVICFVSSGRSAASVASWVSVGLPLRHRYESVPPMVVMGPVKAGRPSESVSADALALTMMNGPDGLALYSHGSRAGSMSRAVERHGVRDHAQVVRFEPLRDVRAVRVADVRGAAAVPYAARVVDCEHVGIDGEALLRGGQL